MRSIVVLAALASAAPALADGVTWRAPAECPDEATLRAAVERRLEQPLAQFELALDVIVSHDATGYVARIDDRTLTSASCSELTDAVAIVVARIAIETAQNAPPAAPTPPPAPPAIVVTAPPPLVPAPRPRPWQLGARLSGLAGLGDVPGLGVAGELAIWARWQQLGFEVAGTRWAARSATLDPGAMAGVDVHLTAIALRAGWHPDRMPVRAWLLAELGSLRGTGVGLDHSRGSSGTWLAAGAGFGIVSPSWRNLRAFAGLDAAAVLDQIRFVLSSGEQIYATPPVAVRIALGLETFF